MNCRLKWLLLSALCAILYPMLADGGTFFTDDLVLKASDGKLVTRAGGVVAAGRLNNDGDALQFGKGSQLLYEKLSVNQDSGTLSFRFRLDFDPDHAVVAESLRRNQIFFTLARPDGFTLRIWAPMAGKIIWVMVNGPNNTIPFLLNAPIKFEQGKWVDFSCSWGDKIVITINGTKMNELKWDGLFGTLPNVDTLSLRLGSDGDMENAFSLSNLRIEDGVERRNPLIGVPLVREAAPIIDGKVEDLFWSNCARFSGFYQRGKLHLSKDQPIAQMGYTDKGIYVAVTSLLPGGRPPIASITKRDGALYNDDAVEVRLVGPKGELYVFIASPTGVKYDAIDRLENGTNYDPEWQLATSKGEGAWTAEMFFPFKAIGYDAQPAAGTVIRGNLAVDVNGFGDGSTWSSADFYNDFTTLGSFFLTGSPQCLRIKLERLFGGQPKVDFEKPGSLIPVTTILASTCDKLGEQISSFDFLMHDGHSCVYSCGNLGPGTHTLRMEAKNSDGMPLLRQRLFFDTEMKAALTVSNFPYLGQATVRASFPTVMKNGQAAKVSFSLLDKDGKIFKKIEGVSVTPSLATGTLSTDALAPGQYVVRADFKDASGNALETAVTDLKIFPKPFWWKNALGLDHTVPPPWTPIQVQQKGFKVWNRELTFNSTVFPKQIVNGNAPLFKTAPRFRLVTNEGGWDLFALPAAKTERFPDEIVLSAHTKGVSVQAKLEFDGLIRFDLSFEPGTVPLTVQALTLELPINAAFSKLLLSGNEQNQGVTCLDKDSAYRFLPFLWLGNHAGGINLFFESDELFTADNPNTFHIARDSQGAATLTANIITIPQTFRSPKTLSFGLLATPVKPNPGQGLFSFTGWGAPEKLSRPEAIIYGTIQGNLYTSLDAIKGLPADQGTIEFFFNRRSAAGKDQTELFSIANPNGSLCATLTNKGELALFSPGGTRFLGGKVEASMDVWHHCAFVRAGETFRLFLDGSLVGEAAVTREVETLWKGFALGDSVLSIGGFNQEMSSSDILVDEIRISKIPRYTVKFQVSGDVFKTDTDTLLLDPLEENFVPDGFSGLTAGGGKPTIGARFTAGLHGKGLSLVNEPVKNGTETLVQEMKNDISEFWDWHDGRQENWPPYFTYQTLPAIEKRVAVAKANHWRRLFFIIYQAVGMPSDLADQFGAEWEVIPRTVMANPPPTGHSMLSISLAAKGYADYIASGIVWLMDHYDVDCIYTDGGCSPMRTSNAAYGQGWVDAKGNRRVTYPFFANRDAMKRFYKIVKAKNPNAIIINHVSFSVPISSLSFGDVIFTGELEDYSDLTMASVRFNPNLWGPFVMVIGRGGAWNEMCTMTGLLNGSPVNFCQGIVGRGDMARKVMLYRHIYEQFGYDKAEWFPWYAAENNLFSINEKKIHAAAYSHNGKSALLLVANYNQAPLTARLKLDLEKFGFGGKKLHAQNALLQIPVNLTGDTLSVKLLPENFTLILITAESGK